MALALTMIIWNVPADYEIDAAHRLIRFRLWGVVTAVESKENRLRMTGDPAFNSDFSLLIDMRGVTAFHSVTADEVRDSASYTHFSPAARRALVATTEVAYGLARMFEIYRDVGDVGVSQMNSRVFRSIEDAEIWLEAEKSK